MNTPGETYNSASLHFGDVIQVCYQDHTTGEQCWTDPYVLADVKNGTELCIAGIMERENDKTMLTTFATASGPVRVIPDSVRWSPYAIATAVVLTIHGFEREDDIPRAKKVADILNNLLDTLIKDDQESPWEYRY